MIKSSMYDHYVDDDDTDSSVIELCDNIEEEEVKDYINILNNATCAGKKSRNYALLYTYILELIKRYFGNNGGITRNILRLYSKYLKEIKDFKVKSNVVLLDTELDKEAEYLIDNFEGYKRYYNKVICLQEYIPRTHRPNHNWIKHPSERLMPLIKLAEKEDLYLYIGVDWTKIQYFRFWLLSKFQSEGTIFEQHEYTDDEIVDLASQNGMQITSDVHGHAMVISNWDEQGITILNSWGKRMGKHGVHLSIHDFKLFTIASISLISLKHKEEKNGDCIKYNIDDIIVFFQNQGGAF